MNGRPAMSFLGRSSCEPRDLVSANEHRRSEPFKNARHRTFVRVRPKADIRARRECLFTPAPGLVVPAARYPDQTPALPLSHGNSLQGPVPAPLVKAMARPLWRIRS